MVGAHFYLIRKGGEVSRTDPPFLSHADRKPVPEDSVMIISVRVNLKEIFIKQRGFAWPKPERCPRCGLSKLWGHGFALGYFDGIGAGLYLRRYRCPECRCVVRLRPKGYFVRIQAPIETIRKSIGQRIRTGRWPSGLCRIRQGHWFKALMQKAVAYLGIAWKGRLLEAFDRLICLGVVPVSRAIDPANGSTFSSAYRRVT